MKHLARGLRGLAALAVGMALLGSAMVSQAAERLPILFVHGNGDSAALWIPTLWRFESNGYDARLLDAVDIPHPWARKDDRVAEANRSSNDETAAAVKAEAGRFLKATGQSKLIIVALSRGSNTARNYIKFGGGKDIVTLAILCGGVSHGMLALPISTGSEFNGMSDFMERLNSPTEVVPGVRYVTIRSDKNDKYAQPTGEYLGMPGIPTRIGYDGPALEGAENLVLPGVDHRETAFAPQAFQVMYKAITGQEPKTLEVTPESRPVVDGMVSGWENGAPTNTPLAGAHVQVYQVDPATGLRVGTVLHEVTTPANGHWGPFKGIPSAYYEIVAAAQGYPTTHFFHTPIPRSTPYLDLRLRPPDPKLRDAGAVVTLWRPRGYLGVGRDTFTIDGKVPAGVPPGVPSVDRASATFPAEPSRSVQVVLNREQMTVRTFPHPLGHDVYATFWY
ncbi:MAG TPA: twin-arginine translocation pathway signal [bacterium]|nr:twin-arginine translocation pathway signal [bacterium]